MASTEEIILRFADGRTQIADVTPGIKEYRLSENAKSFEIKWPLEYPMPPWPLVHRVFLDSGQTRGDFRIFVEEETQE